MFVSPDQHRAFTHTPFTPPLHTLRCLLAQHKVQSNAAQIQSLLAKAAAAAALM